MPLARRECPGPLGVPQLQESQEGRRSHGWLPPPSALPYSLEGTVAQGMQESADPAMCSCHPPVTRPVWLASSRRSLLPEDRLDHPALACPLSLKLQKNPQKTRAQEIWPQDLSCHSLGETLDYFLTIFGLQFVRVSKERIRLEQ